MITSQSVLVSQEFERSLVTNTEGITAGQRNTLELLLDDIHRIESPGAQAATEELDYIAQYPKVCSYIILWDLCCWYFLSEI